MQKHIHASVKHAASLNVNFWNDLSSKIISLLFNLLSYRDKTNQFTMIKSSPIHFLHFIWKQNHLNAVSYWLQCHVMLVKELLNTLSSVNACYLSCKESKWLFWVVAFHRTHTGCLGFNRNTPEHVQMLVLRPASLSWELWGWSVCLRVCLSGEQRSRSQHSSLTSAWLQKPASCCVFNIQCAWGKQIGQQKLSRVNYLTVPVHLKGGLKQQLCRKICENFSICEKSQQQASWYILAFF